MGCAVCGGVDKADTVGARSARGTSVAQNHTSGNRVCVDCGKEGCSRHGVDDADDQFHHGVCPPVEGFASNLAKLHYEEERLVAADRLAAEASETRRARRIEEAGPLISEALAKLPEAGIRSFALYALDREVVGRLRKRVVRHDTAKGRAWVVIAHRQGGPRGERYEVLSDAGEIYRDLRVTYNCGDPTHEHDRECPRVLGIEDDRFRPVAIPDVSEEFMGQLRALVDDAIAGTATDTPVEATPGSDDHDGATGATG